MTRLYEDHDPYVHCHPDRVGIRNFTWTLNAIQDWESIWHSLWRLGYKWEWQDSDRYVRRRGDTYDLFSCHGDAARLDMAIPLPGIILIEEIKERLLDHPSDDVRVSHAIVALEAWLNHHYTH